ncbi:MAG: radical SAM protein [Candidatus Aenigmatarchaeota archaeon]
MKVLLANPPGPWIRCRWDIELPEKNVIKYFPYPVRLAYATGVLKKHGYDALMIDCTAEEINRREFIKRFKKLKPNIIIWETTASSFDYDLETIKKLKKINPKVLIGASGYHATPTYKECLEGGYDFVIVGECDYSILDFVKWFNKEIKKFPRGVAMKRHKFVSRPLIKNINELPWPERESLPMKKYNDPKLHGFNLVIISSRGCPWGCNFCTSSVYYRNTNYRMRDPLNVVDEMEYLWNKYKPDELYFDDDNFAVNKKHVRDICNDILKRKLKISWNCMVDALIDFKLMKLMKKAGCTGITIGAESADDKVLKQMEGKPITRAYIKKFISYCRKLKLRSHVCWVLGMKGSSKESDMDTIKFAIELNSDTLQFAICVPFVGTRLYKWCSDKGYLAGSWRDIKGNSRGIVSYPNYSHEEIEDMLKYAFKMWHRKMLFKRPDIIIFHFYNLYKYQGFGEVIKVSLKNLKEIF